MPGSSLSPDEERLAKDWKINDNMAPSKIAGLLRRDKSTITRLLKRTVPRKKRGPKLMLTDAQVDALVAKMKDMIAKANGRWEVTVAMLKKSSHCGAGMRTILNAMHARGIYFYVMRQKPMLTDEDIVDRYQSGWNYVERPRSWWGVCAILKVPGLPRHR